MAAVGALSSVSSRSRGTIPPSAAPERHDTAAKTSSDRLLLGAAPRELPLALELPALVALADLTEPPGGRRDRGTRERDEDRGIAVDDAEPMRLVGFPHRAPTDAGSDEAKDWAPAVEEAEQLAEQASQPSPHVVRWYDHNIHRRTEVTGLKPKLRTSTAKQRISATLERQVYMKKLKTELQERKQQTLI